MKKLVFLHIPKTAGQSVHKQIESLYSRDEICPARLNNQLSAISISEMNRYRVFSGHLDWSMLDCIKGDKYVFTVLREPVSRIVSFYTFLRQTASRLTPDQLAAPSRQGLKAALELPCDEYFCGGPNHLREFLDNHYDNFYMYYFAGRTYDGRRKILSAQKNGEELSKQHVLNMAHKNLDLVDGVFTPDTLSELDTILQKVSGRQARQELAITKVNVGDQKSLAERIEWLKDIGATNRTFDKIAEMTSYDKEIYETWKVRALSYLI